MLQQVLPGLVLELGHVEPDRHIGQGDNRRIVDQLVLKVGVDHDLLPLGDQLDERPQLLAHRLQHRRGDAFPPLLGHQVLNQHKMGLDGRDVGLLVQQSGDLLDTLL